MYFVDESHKHGDNVVPIDFNQLTEIPKDATLPSGATLGPIVPNTFVKVVDRLPDPHGGSPLKTTGYQVQIDHCSQTDQEN